jgi:hypothetical protein
MKKRKIKVKEKRRKSIERAGRQEADILEKINKIMR